MSGNIMKYGLILLKVVLAVVFVSAGLAKLFGAEMMIQTYEKIGVGQWFRYVTAIIEIGSAFLLFLPQKQAFGAALLVCTMLGAILAHLFVLGPSAMPAAILGILSAIVLYAHREQLPININQFK